VGVAIAIAIACCLAAGPAWADEGGHQAGLTVNPDKVNFGHQAVGLPTNPVTIKVDNSGTSTVTFDHLSIDVVHGDAGAFTELDVLKAVQCDGNASTLPPQHSCLLFVQFIPASKGQTRADLEVSFTATQGGDQGDQGGDQGDHDHGRTAVDLEVSLKGIGVASA
jgi:hypothetical protein